MRYIPVSYTHLDVYKRQEHPYGHARYEYLAGLAVSVMILVIGVELLKESFAKVLHPTEVAFSWLMVAVLLASILVKLWMSRLNRQIGTAIDSETLLATAADARNDVITTAAVLAATILTKLTGFVRIDGLMGIGVAAFILYSGAMLVKDTINPLLGAAPDSDLVEHIEKKALSYPGVLGVHDLMIHDYGPGSRLVSFHLEMDAKDDVMHSHDAVSYTHLDVYKRQVQRYGSHGKAAGHLHSGQQGVQTVHGAALHRDAHNGQGGVGGKGTGQVRGHAGSAENDAVALGTGALGERGGGLRCAVGRKNVRLIRHAEILQHRAGTLDHRPVTVRAHDDRNFFHTF